VVCGGLWEHGGINGLVSDIGYLVLLLGDDAEEWNLVFGE
jgi:hypothetical protein